MSNTTQQNLMDYLTMAGYEVKYRINTDRQPLATAEKEFCVSVQLGDHCFEGVSGQSFSLSEERLVLGLLKALKLKMEEGKEKNEEQSTS